MAAQHCPDHELIPDHYISRKLKAHTVVKDGVHLSTFKHLVELLEWCYNREIRSLAVETDEGLLWLEISPNRCQRRSPEGETHG